MMFLDSCVSMILEHLCSAQVVQAMNVSLSPDIQLLCILPQALSQKHEHLLSSAEAGKSSLYAASFVCLDEKACADLCWFR